MPARRPNPKLVKIHRSYTVEEVAGLFGIHRNTVRDWNKRGLATIDHHRPALIKGTTLAEFVRMRRGRNKRPCGPGEIYCVRCREPRAPRDLLGIYRPLTPTQGNLIGICPECQSRMFRRVSMAKLAQAGGQMRITMPEAQEHIDECPQPSVNCDLNRTTPDHADAQPPQ